MRIKNLLLSYPRSGNTWCRYFIEYVSEMPTRGCGGAVYDQYIKRKPHRLNYRSLAIVQKEHFARKCLYHNPKRDNIILIIRNPKECIVRHNGPEILSSKRLGVVLSEYMSNLKLYDEWTSKRMLVYYEDIIKNFKAESKRIVEFLNLKPDRYHTFMKNYDYHRKRCIEIYSNGRGLSKTKGKKAIHHSKSNKNFGNMNNIIDKVYPKFKKTYLKRYF